MKIVKKNVYYCEFCKKKGLSSYHIRCHEEQCTLNPERNCKFCDRKTSEVIESFWTNPEHTLSRINGDDTLIGRIKQIKDNGCWTNEHGEESFSTAITREEIKQLKKWFDCPICLLSFLRLNKLDAYHWDWKQECLDIFKERSDDEEKDGLYSTFGGSE